MWKTLGAIGALAILPMATPARASTAPCDLAAHSAKEAGDGCAAAWIDANLRLNDLVTVGTHNSYKTAIPDAVMARIRAAAPDKADSIDYRHRSLSEQLDAGARQLEIDVYYDPRGGRYLDPAGLRAAGISLDPARRAALAEPGFKVMHIQDVDVLSSCVTLRACLGTVQRWSLAHPGHAPILLMFNAKADRSPLPGGVDALPFDTAAFDALDREIREVLPARSLITPDDVQGRYPTLREAVLHHGWPTLGQARGKILFALDEGPETVAVYRGQRRSLEGRVFFINTDENSPAAAYLTLNDPIAEGERIRKAVAAGFIVRTRADADTSEARANDHRRSEAAFASGAQFISTDYLWPDARFHNDYQVRLPAGAASQCNPLRTGDRCGGQMIEQVGTPPSGYLSAEATPDGLRILPPPPQPGSAVARADRAVFDETRALAGTPRWQVAKSDVESGAFGHFACALGVRLTTENAPVLARLLDRTSTAGVVDPVKRTYQAPRPYLGTKAPVCQSRTAALAANGDYPSGHAAGGWMEALILAELAPDRATEILARGRAFGESRYICGAHSRSAVEAGWMAGAAAAAALHGSAEFRADLDAARAELAKVRATAPAPDAGACRAEADALSAPVRRR